MGDPYRGSDQTCPACGAALREFHGRLACDACGGVMVSVVDLGRAIFEMTSLEPAFVFEKEQAGSRRCPWCRAVMATCRVVIVLEESSEKPRTTLDRCGEHGIWCDEGELAQLFEKIAGKGFGGGGGRTFDRPRAPADRGGWSAVFKIGGARGGWG